MVHQVRHPVAGTTTRSSSGLRGNVGRQMHPTGRALRALWRCTYLVVLASQVWGYASMSAAPFWGTVIR